jgi:hypothetical protein
MEMQIKTTVRFHLTPVIMAIINTSQTKIMNVGKDVENKEVLARLVRMYINSIIMESTVEISQKTKNRISYILSPHYISEIIYM